MFGRCGADLRGAILDDVKMEGARYDATTRWPYGFDPKAAGAVEMTLSAP